MASLKKWFLNLDDFLAGLSLTMIILVTVVGVFMRFVLGEPLVWTEEVSLALFVWFTFLGASAVTKENGHVGIDYFVMKFSPRMKLAAEIFREITIIFINVYVLVYLGSKLTLIAGDKITSVLGISYMLIDLSVVLGGVLGTFHLIRHIIILMQKISHHPPTDKELKV